MLINTYAIKLNVIPAKQEDSQIVPGGFQALASLAGINSNSSKQDNYSLYKSLITSHVVSEILFEDKEFMLNIFENHWDADQERWKTPTRSFRGKMLIISNIFLDLQFILELQLIP